jgi:hypothetical protein
MTWNCMVLSLDEFDGSSNLPTWAVWTSSSQNCIQIQQPQIKHPKEVGVGQVCTWLALLLVLNTLKKTKVHNMENPWTSFKVNGFNRKWPTNLSGWIIIIHQAENQCCHAAIWGWFPKPNHHSSDVMTWGYSTIHPIFSWMMSSSKPRKSGFLWGFSRISHGFPWVFPWISSGFSHPRAGLENFKRLVGHWPQLIPNELEKPHSRPGRGLCRRPI